MPDAMSSSIAFLLAASVFLAPISAFAQALVAPEEVTIYVHSKMRDADFVDGLVCELGRVLVAPVRVATIDMPFGTADFATRTQLRVEDLGPAFDRATAGDRARTFRYLLLSYDLKATGLNYVFANTFLDGSRVGVLSAIRLVPHEPGLSHKRISDVTGDRLYKLMLKSVALLAGLRSDGCIMKFPRSLDELDEKPAEFCPADRAALVAAGVLKARPYGACNIVAWANR